MKTSLSVLGVQPKPETHSNDPYQIYWYPSKMSLIGQVFNKTLSKTISVYIAESGEGFKRLTGAIGQDVKEAALAKVKERFENGTLFKDDDMQQMERVTIT